jgi:uncharacterized repeat protein (TIGR01451 family)
MIDSSKPGPKRARWVAAAIAMLAAVLLGLVQPISDVSAQSFAGGNMTLISCAATTAGPICTGAGVPTSTTSRDVILAIDVPASGLTGQTFNLVRFTSNAGVITGPTTTALVGSTQTSLPFSPALSTGQVVQFGTRAFIRDTVPTGQQVACYQVLINGGTARSDFECIVFGVAQGLIPADVGVALQQGQNLQVTWQASTDSRVRSYLVYSLGTDGVQVVPQPAVAGQLSATLPGTGGLICAVVIPLDANNASLGASNLQCGFPGNALLVGQPIPTSTAGPTNTRTNTPVITASAVTSTATRTNTAVSTTTAVTTNTTTAVPTNTNVPPTNTAVPTSTNTSIPTITSTPSPADLTIAKVSQPTSTTSGNVVTYTITVGNAGGTPAVPVAVTDVLPPGVTLLNASGTNGFTCGAPTPGNVMACSGGNLPPNSSATITVIVLVNTPCTNLSPFVNRAIVNPSNTIPENNTANNQAVATTVVSDCPAATATVTSTATATASRTATITNTPSITLTPLPDFSITKTGPSSVSQGQSITYVITVSETGSVPQGGVVVQDNLPAQVTFVSASGSNGFNCSEAAGVVGCTGGILIPGSSAQITIFGLVAGCASPLVNTAIVNPGNVIPESNFANNTATVTTTETGCPAATVTATVGGATPTLNPSSLSVSKASNPNIVVAGQPVSYVVTVSNGDSSAAPNVQFVDALPAGVTFASAQDNAPGSGVPFSCGSANGEVVCSGGTIPAGGTRSVTISVVTDNPCVVVSPVRNIVRLNPNGYPIVVVGPTTPTPTVNPGPTAVADTTIINCITATASPTITNTATATFTKTAVPTVTSTPVPTNTPTVTLTPAVDLSITKIDAPDPVTNPGGGVNNGNITYTIVVNNSGSIAASNVTVLDTLENGSNFRCPGSPIAFQCNPADPNANNAVTFLTAAGDNGFICNVSVTFDAFGTPQQQVGCTGGNIGPNGGATITIVVSTSAGCTTLLNRAVVDPTNNITERDENNNTAFQATACGAGANTPTTLPTLTPTATATNTPVPTSTATPFPTAFTGLSFTKAAAPSVVNTTGQPITYTLSITNNNAQSMNFTPNSITDVLNAQTNFVSASGTNGITCGSSGVPGSGSETVVCGDGTVAAGATATINIVVLYTGPSCVVGGGSISNTANLFSGGQTPQTSNTTSVAVAACAATVTPTITSTPTITLTPTITSTPVAGDLSGTKSQPATLAGGTSTMTYTLNVTATGASFSNITVRDPATGTLPSNFAFTSALASNGFNCSFASGVVTCNGGTLTAGQTATIQINGTTTSCTTLPANTFRIDPNNTLGETNEANNDVTSGNATTLTCVDLAVSKTSPVSGFNNQPIDTSGGPGSITWRLSTTNNGSATAPAGSVVLTDVQPAGFTFSSFANVAGTWSCSGSQTITCTLQTALAPAGTATVDVTSLAATTLTAGDKTNTVTATINTGNPQTTPGPHQASAITTVYPYDLNVTVTDAPDPVVSTPICCELTYTITVVNGSAGAQTAFPFWLNGSLAIRDAGNAQIPGIGTPSVAPFASIFSMTSSRGTTDTCTFQPAPFGVQQYTCAMASMTPGEIVTITVLVDAISPEPDGNPDVSLDANVMNRQRPLGSFNIGCSNNIGLSGGTSPACAGERAVSGSFPHPTFTSDPPTTILSNNRDNEFTDVD